MNTKDELRTSGRGVCERLRDRLMELEGLLGDRSHPIITVTYAQSIDGCIAPIGGGPLQLSNPLTHKMTHQIRSMHDAILVGINTVLCDDPQLTVRLTPGNSPQPIVLDSRLRFPMDAKLLRRPCIRPIIATGPEACQKKERRLTEAGARVVRVPVCGSGLIDLSQFLPLIKQLGLKSVMVEGGSQVITNMLARQVADHLLVAISPCLIGGLHAVIPGHVCHPLPKLRDVYFESMDNDMVVWGHFGTVSDA